jgi:hypothetical protein
MWGLDTMWCNFINPMKQWCDLWKVIIYMMDHYSSHIAWPEMAVQYTLLLGRTTKSSGI